MPHTFFQTTDLSTLTSGLQLMGALHSHEANIPLRRLATGLLGHFLTALESLSDHHLTGQHNSLDISDAQAYIVKLTKIHECTNDFGWLKSLNLKNEGASFYQAHPVQVLCFQQNRLLTSYLQISYNKRVGEGLFFPSTCTVTSV